MSEKACVGPLIVGYVDVALAFLCAGLVGPKGDRTAELREIGALAEDREFINGVLAQWYISPGTTPPIIKS